MPELDAAEISRAKTIVFRFLKYRPRSEKEIVDKLQQKGVSTATVTLVLEYFRKAKLIDDVLFARGWVASRLRKPLGLRRIRQELKAKGISDEVITQELPSAEGDYNETTSALELAQKRFTKYKGVPKLKAKKRVYDYLVRRGFSFASVQRALTELGKSPS